MKNGGTLQTEIIRPLTPKLQTEFPLTLLLKPLEKLNIDLTSGEEFLILSLKLSICSFETFESKTNSHLKNFPNSSKSLVKKFERK